MDELFDDAPGSVPELDMSNFVFTLQRRDAAVVLNNKYLLGKEIGKGATAQIIDTLDLVTLQRKVLKIFRISRRPKFGSTSTQSMVKQVSDEYLILRRLNHCNVIKAYEMFKQQDECQITLSVVMEYCCGSLEELRMSSPHHRLPLANCHFYFHQLIDGVEYLHCNSIVHGDIKPDNLMIINDNTLKIADFGSCSQLDIFTASPKKGMSGSSPYFQPPESLIIDLSDDHEDKQSKERIERGLTTADVWSCGIVLYMIACGRHPFLESDLATESDLYDSIIKKRFESSPVIEKNRALEFLFEKIFRTDIRHRATITDIRRDAWFNISINPSQASGIGARTIGEGRTGDKYRSMTVTQALNQFIRPIHEELKIKGKDLDDHERRKEIPYLRANRSPEPQRLPPKSMSKMFRQRMTNLWRRF